MIKINEILKTYKLTAKRIEKIGKITIIDDGEKKYVYKESTKRNVQVGIR